MNERLSDMQKEMKESAQKVWFAGLGALSVAGEEGTKLFKNLVEKGREFEAKERPPVEKMKEKVSGAKDKAEELWSKLEGTFTEKVGVALQKLGVPTKTEIEQLTERVDALMDAIKKMETKKKPTAKASK